MFKKAMIVVLVVIFFLPTLVFNQTNVSAQGFEFRDIPIGTWGYDEIHYLNEKRIQTGYGDGTFRPNNSLTRAQAAVVITNALGVGGKRVTKATFPDVPTNFWASEAIEKAAELGVFSGRDGRFHPNEKISRAQVAAVLAKTFKLSGSTTSGFSDVPNNFWAVSQISALERNGILENSSRFNPNGNTTRADFAVFLARSIEPTFRVSNQDLGKALYQGTVVNVTSTLNVRSKPGMDGAVVDRLAAGRVIDVYGEEGNWLKIAHKNGFAYVHKNYIQRVTSSGTGSTPTPPPSSNDRKVVAEGKVTATSLNVRQQATASSATLGRLSAGEIVNIYEYHGDWVLIQFNGQWAYTHSGYLVTKAPGQNALQNRIIALDPGHGGSDPGAVANGLREKDINLGIAKELEKMLLDKSAKPFLTRTNDTFIELSQRAKMANDRNADIFISIHANAATPAANGVETYWNDTYSAAESRALAQHINRHLKNELGMNDRGVKEARFAVIRQSRMPSVLVEVGFITNSGDAAKMKKPDFNEKAARAILKGIEDYYNW